MKESCLFWQKTIYTTPEARQWLPIMALVIGWYFLKESIGFQRKDRCCHHQQLTTQELLQLLRYENRKKGFLSILVIGFSSMLYQAVSMLNNLDN